MDQNKLENIHIYCKEHSEIDSQNLVDVERYTWENKYSCINLAFKLIRGF